MLLAEYHTQLNGGFIISNTKYMKIGILGVGHIGKTLARTLARQDTT
jgi:lactate dehydrogenase-like 2-hydroxyacid dehydrogenase